MRSFINFLFVFFPILAYSQNLEINITAERSTVYTNQPIKIIIYTNHKGLINENWPKDFVLKNTPSFNSKFIKNPQNSSIDQEHIVTFIGSFSESGRKTIGPFEINLDGKKKKSNVIEINVLKEGEKQLQTNTIEFTTTEHLILNKTSIYEGEAVHLLNYLTSDNPYGKLSIKEPLKLSGTIDQFQLPIISKWYQINVNGQINWQYPINSVLIYPLISDNFKIEPSEIIYSNVKGTKTMKPTIPTLKIKPLPPLAPNSFYGAVGTFDIKQNAKNQNLRQGDVTPLELIISGEGNFHQFTIPKLQLPNGVQIYGEPTLSESIENTENGMIGQIIYKYNLQIFEIGIVKIPSIAFTYFDVKKEKYITKKDSTELIFNVLSNTDYQRDYNKAIHLNKKENIAPFTTIEPITASRYIVNNPIYWILLIGIPALTFTILILNRKENEFLEKRFKKLKRKPNHIKRKLKKLYHKKDSLSEEDLKDVILLITFMINKRRSNTIVCPENLFAQLNNPEILLPQDATIKNELTEIVELIYKNLYAFFDQKTTKEIIDKLKKIAVAWKQI